MRSHLSDLPRLLLVGSGPLPPERPERLYAPAIRLWGMARELLRAGHELRVLTVHYEGGPLEAVFARDFRRFDPGSVFPEARRIELSGADAADAIARELREFGAEGAIGVAEMGGRHLARAGSEGGLATDLPMWFDFFGDPMAERQMLAALHESDDLTADQWATYAAILRRADRVSGCSRHQAGALMGELGAVGRLNRHTAAAPLVHVVEPWIEAIEPDDSGEPVVRGRSAPADSVIAIQTGGFNTWLDVETLFAALERVMERHDRFHFAATGGALTGHIEGPFARFKALAEASRFADRFHLLGWLPLGRVPRAIAECDLGLNVDRPCVEGWLGTRNRVLDWTMAGLPVVSTVGCELVESLVERGLIEGARQGDADSVAGGIERVLGNIEAARAQAERAREHLRTHHRAARCLAPLIEWARRPERAPDLQSWRRGESPASALWKASADPSALAADLETARASRVRSESRVLQLEGSRLVRAAMRLRKWLRS